MKDSARLRMMVENSDQVKSVYQQQVALLAAIVEGIACLLEREEAK